MRAIVGSEDFSATADDPAVSEAVDEAEWSAFVDGCAAASAYHQWGWRRVFERAFGHETLYLGARAGGRLVGVLPLVFFDSWLFGRFLVSLPFVNYGGVLADEGPAADALVARAVEMAGARGCAHLELRHRARRFAALHPKQHKVAMFLPLAQSEEAAWQALDRKVRNQVRKAEKSGLTASSGGAELIGGFYEVFSRNMRDLGTPVYSAQFFSEVLRQFPETVRVFVVRHGELIVAGAVTIGHRHAVEVPWASSLKDYRALCPNNLLYWTMIRHAIDEGYRVFDFGRSTPDEGTFHFKRQWGAEPEPLWWEYWLEPGRKMPDQSPKNPKFALAIAAWQRLPLRVTTLLGPRIVRGIP
jgi:FemAB-related protein (PEP-CTERM system-associated)